MQTLDRKLRDGFADVHREARLLFVGEYPPSNHHGGAILLKRLLENFPALSLTVITSRTGMKASQPTGLLSCRHIVMSGLDASTNVRIRSLIHALDWMTLVLVAFRVAWETRRWRADVLISVVQGRFYLAAALVAWMTGTAHVTIVHDNFTGSGLSRSSLLRKMKLGLTQKVLGHAAWVYAVSPEMKELIFKQCGVKAELQMPSTEAAGNREAPPHVVTEDGPILMFAGQVGYTVRDALDLLAGLIKSGRMKQYVAAKVRLHLYTNLTKAQCDAAGWDHEDIVWKGWVPQDRLASVLSTADILFLPYSFSAEAREAVQTAFPSKTADYLAAGKPILVLGPQYSTLVRYARQQGFAAIVDTLSEDALARSIEQIVVSSAYREQLVTNARSAFLANHDIRQQEKKFHAQVQRIAEIKRSRAQPC